MFVPGRTVCRHLQPAHDHAHQVCQREVDGPRVRGDEVRLGQVRLDSGDEPRVVAAAPGPELPAGALPAAINHLDEAAAAAWSLLRPGDQELLDGFLAGRPVPVPVQVDDRRKDLGGTPRLDGDDLYPVPVRDGDGAVSGSEVDAVGNRFAVSPTIMCSITIPAARTVADAPGWRRRISSSSVSCSRLQAVQPLAVLGYLPAPSGEHPAVAVGSGCLLLPDPGLLLLDQRSEPHLPVAEDPLGPLERLVPCGIVVRLDPRCEQSRSPPRTGGWLAARAAPAQPGTSYPWNRLTDRRHGLDLRGLDGQVRADQMPDKPAGRPNPFAPDLVVHLDPLSGGTS